MSPEQRRVIRDCMVDHGDRSWQIGDVEDGTSRTFLFDDIINSLNKVGLDLELVEIE